MRFLFLFFPLVLFASWAQETLEEMSLEEKIGQLFMAPACPKRGEDHWADWMRILKDCHVGCAIMKPTDSLTQVEFLNSLQSESKIPLLIAADAEWGLAMRMSDTIAFPRNMTLGAIADPGLICQMGREIGRQAKLVGVHLNLAPVADVNNNPANPIIHMRSFGENPQLVANNVSAYLRGLQEVGTLACAKHFPGHGDTTIDSHFNLPFLPFTKERLARIEFVPFQQAIQDGVAAIMSAHLSVPCIDPVYPTSLSHPCLQKVLREELGFRGLIVSDALNMLAIASRYSPEQVAFLARAAGCDVLLYGDHKDPNVDQIMRDLIPRAFRALRGLYLEKHLDLTQLDASVLRILEAKEKLGLHLERSVVSKDLLNELHREEALALKKELFQAAVTLIGDEVFLMKNIAYLNIGDKDVLGQKFPTVFSALAKVDREGCDDLFRKLQGFDQVVIGIHQVSQVSPREKNYGFSEELLDLIHSLSAKSVLCLFATPYALQFFKGQRSILVGYENDPDAQWAVYEVLRGKEKPKGKLPVSVE